MHELKVGINPKEVGKSFAYSYDVDQGDLINSLAEELYVYCGGGHDYKMQICHISDKLSKRGCSFIKALQEFIDLREEE